jgi:hypothetical protein
MSTIAGDVLLSAEFMTYGGVFNQSYCHSMWEGWVDHLKYKADFSLTEYLSTANDRLDWQSKSLPADDLCTENAIPSGCDSQAWANGCEGEDTPNQEYSFKGDNSLSF